ncbi:MAG: hypothetical protein OXQ86_09755 [Gammaproteobacteria bacterium]|nr:hypothetical protein [Gammaproteobacteria bacterium]MDE0412775.1 hypothetical protein [Gammaproteobacteria bacterium]
MKWKDKQQEARVGWVIHSVLIFTPACILQRMPQALTEMNENWISLPQQFQTSDFPGTHWGLQPTQTSFFRYSVGIFALVEKGYAG